MEYRSTIDQRYSSDVSNRERDIPSFIEPRPPLILNPFMRPRPQKGTNLLELFEEDDSVEEEGPELVQVYLRLKPSNVPSSLYEVRSDQCLVTSVDTATAGHGRRTQHNVCKMYSFSHIFGPDANQKEIFEHVVKGNLRKLPDGHSFTLLTYGASGSGKTYTLMGTVKAPGLVPRSLEYVFKVVEAAQMPLHRPGEIRANKLSLAEQEYELQWVRNLRHLSAPLREKYRRMSTQLCSDMSRSTVDLSKRTKHYVWVSFVEIYNEAIYDLLVTTDRTAASKLRIREDPSGNVYVKGARQAFVRTGEEAYDVLVAGKHNLQVHATGVHAQSSRSHCIFTITMLTETECGVRASHVRLCDLAGSERARRTRNTGARMQESRAINSSLHVLERCLHTLRRKQGASKDLVPYRESKLTRLLGAGLSGTRGEAVSMVVTLNPAPEFAHETRHVLQLAAVARDIQVNNTIAESISTLETTTISQDTTVASSAEVTRLRADNERLHYELVQAEALNRKLMEDIADQQQENAVTVKELVEEARDITVQYYKSQLRSLDERHKAEIAELRDEYEAKLAKVVVADEGTPSRALQNKVMQLMKQIAILEEELNAERLARARMKEEMLHLRACIEERDEKSTDDAIQLTDSEDESDAGDDLCNDSLEPTFKKEEINRSRLIRQSTLETHTRNTTFDNMDRTHENMDRTHDNMDRTHENMDMTHGTLKDESLGDETYDISKKDTTITEETGDDTYDATNNDTNQSMDCPATVKKAELIKDSEVKQNSYVESKVVKDSARGTYFVRNSYVSLSSEKEDSIQNDTGHLADVSVSLREDDDLRDYSIIGDVEKPIKKIETQIDKIKKFAMGTVSSDGSLTQFEMLEMEMYEKSAFKYFDDGSAKKSIGTSPRKKEKKPYFDNIQPSLSQISMVKDLIKKQDVLRSPSIVQDEIPENYKPTTINKIMRESFTVSTEVPLYKNKVLKKMPDSIDPFEGADSPDLFKSMEQARMSIENVSLDVKQEESNTDNVKDMVENEIKLEMMEEVVKNVNNTEIVEEVENEIKTESIVEVSEKNICNESKTFDVALPKEDKISEEKALNIPSSLNEIENTTNLELEQDLLAEAKQDILAEVKQDILVEVKQEEIDTENVNKDTEKEVQSKELPQDVSSFNDITYSNQTMAADNNTIDAFENIYKDITMPRATEFDLLVSDKSLDVANKAKSNNIEAYTEKSDIDIEPTVERHEKKDKDVKKDVNDNNNEEKAIVPKTVKYNLRHKTQDTSKTDNDETTEHTEKCAPRTAKKSLRLRRRNKIDEPVEDEENLKNIVNLQKDEVKLQDIVNLQKEFSDVTMGVPAPVKVVKEMASPEKSESENLPPLMGVQSCPSKSVTRSRRKLFTPRAEPLEESPPAGDSAERVRVPRPSYHRARTRRRLN